MSHALFPLVVDPVSAEDSNSQIAIHSPEFTRVMSPNDASDQATMVERWGIRGARQPCEICNGMVTDPWVCSACYKTGHQECLQAVQLEGYAFCSVCHPWAIDQHSRCVTEAQRERWAIRLASQLANWRSMTTNATGALGAVGLAIGGAGAMVLGGTSALVRGAVQGAKATSRALSPAAIEDEAPSSSETKAKSGHCLACWKPQLGNLRPISHLYAGDCKFQERSMVDQTNEAYDSSALGCHGVVAIPAAIEVHGSSASGCHGVVDKTTEVRGSSAFGCHGVVDGTTEVCGSSAFGCHGVVGQAIEVHGSSAFRRHGVVHQTVEPIDTATFNAADVAVPPGSFESLPDVCPDSREVGNQPALFPDGGGAPRPDLDVVLQAIQSLRQEVRSERLRVDKALTSQEQCIQRVEEKHRHFTERFDVLEQSLTTLQVQHAEVAADLKSTQDRLAQLESESAYASWDRREQMEQQLEHDLLGVMQSQQDGCDPVSNILAEVRGSSALGCHGVARQSDMPSQQQEDLIDLLSSPRDLTSHQARPGPGTTTELFAIQDATPSPRIPPAMSDLKLGLSSAVVAYHVPQEMQSSFTQPGGIINKTPTGTEMPRQPSTSDYTLHSVPVGALGATSGSGPTTDVETFSFTGDLASPLEAVHSLSDPVRR